MIEILAVLIGINAPSQPPPKAVDSIGKAPIPISEMAEPVASQTFAPLETVEPIKPPPPPPAPKLKASSAGNTYYKGYCTWYAKSRRPDLPNSLGNAITWASRARALGFQVSSIPGVGTIGQKGNHVVYVEQVSDGRIYLSAMNDVGGFGIVSQRWDNASEYTYIY